MFKIIKTITAIAVSFSLMSTLTFADAISKWSKGEFSLSTISEKKELKN